MIKKFFKVLFALAILSGVAQAQYSAPSMHRAYNVTLFNGTSPASASTVAQTAVTGLDTYAYCWIYSKIQGGTGGTLDVYLQTSPDAGTTWVDVGHYTQLAAAAPLAGSVVAFSKWGPTVSTAPTSTATTVNTVSGTPVVAAGTFLPGVLGNALRVVFVAGTGTTAGTAQVITAFCSTS
jgi:hypothetical protein